MMIQSLGDNSTTSTVKSPDLLNKNVFFKLLVKELTHQDPMEPMNSREFLTQLAQFSSVEKLNSIHEELDAAFEAQMLYQGSQMLGSHVEGIDPSTGEQIQGKVSQVSLKDGTVYLTVADRYVPLSSVINISSK